eukprot:scaffold23446_cov77-Attheya_sp.AAC.1
MGSMCAVEGWFNGLDSIERYEGIIPPVELAEYAINSKIDDEPAFAWWVPYVMKKRDRIISKVKSKYWARTHKYGIRVPNHIKEAKEIDLENGDTQWMDS